MIQINIDDVSPERQSLYREALRRMRDVEISDDSAADAVIAGDCTQAANAKIPCLLERPESSSPEQIESLSSSGARIMPAHGWRFLPSVLPVQQRNAAGDLGEPGLLRAHCWLTENQPLAQVAFGQVDLAQCLFGTRAEISHILQRQNYLQLHLGFPNDGMAIIDVATARPGSDPYYSMHLIGSNGAAYADDHHNAQLLFGGDGARALLHRQNQLLATQNLLAEFVSGISEDRDWSVRIQDTLDTLDTLELLKEVPDV